MNSVTQNPVVGMGVGPFMMQSRNTVADESTPMLRQFLRIALRWRYVLLGIIAGCMVLGLIITLLMTPQYTAIARIEISREANQVTNFQAVEREANPNDQEFYQTQYGLMASRTLSERVAAQLRLVDNPDFFKMFDAGGNDPAFEESNGRYTAKGRATRQRIAGAILLDHLAVEPARLSRLADIRFTSPDAELSKRVVNTWADVFIQTNLERKVQATVYGRNLLQRELGQAKNRLDESQRQLVGYATSQRIINLPAQGSGEGATAERSIVADNLAGLNSALTQATSDRITAEAKFRQAGQAGSSGEALRNATISSLRQRRAELASDYQRLLSQFEPGYPPAKAIQSQITQLDRSISREESRVSSSVEAEYKQAAERENALEARVDQLKTSYLDQRRRSIQYNIFQQEVDTNRALYDGLLQRYKEIGVANGVGINNVSVVDLAEVPQRPSSPRLLINLLIALLAGLILGGATAFALEHIDEAIADPGEVERLLGLPLLGSVPKVEGMTPQSALLDRKSDIVDAYLAVQTNLGFTTEHGVPRSIAVTSTRPAEGKSTTALALATTLARANRRVILVDGDMRSPSIHHLGGVGHEKGLSNFLAGQDDIATLTFAMTDFGITAMSAGPIPPNAAELLMSNRLALLIERLLQTYDHVVIDSPPVMGLADAPLIGAQVEGIIYAVESHGIRSSLVKTALTRLASANARVIGGVLTKFESRKGYGYDYGYGYGRGERTGSQSA
jgi:succinoglycan biosynthesis transport protein ExoP